MQESKYWMGSCEPTLGLFDLVSCWDLAGGTDLWKLLSQVKPGALEIRESFPSGLGYAMLSSS